jgi:hypothetical protein
MSHRSIKALLLCLPALPLACGVEEPAPPVTPSVEVIRPTAVETLALAIEEHALPSALQNDATLSIAAVDGLGVLAGGAGGLFFLGSTGFEQLDASPVLGLAAFEDRSIVVASDRGLLFWSGEIADSPLNSTLNNEIALAIATRGNDLYLSTASALWLFSGGELWSFDTLGGTRALSASAGAEDVIAGMSALRQKSGSWEVRALSEEIGAARAVPGSGGRILALDANGALKQRVVGDEAAVVWSPVALSTDATDPGSSGVSQVAVDPVTGAIWAIDASSIHRIDHGRIGKIGRPANMSEPKAISVTADGAVWISDGTTLFRIGNEGRPITWSEDIATFSANNCERCHAPLKVAHPLNSYELWVGDIDRIVADLEIMKMPQDGAALVGGTVDLIRRWRDEGLRE